MAEIFRKSSKGKIEFTLALMHKGQQTEQRFHRMFRLWVVPASVLHAMKLMQPMAKRYRKGDYRHTDSEAKAEHEVSLFINNQHRHLEGLPPLRKAEWGDFCSPEELAVEPYDSRKHGPLTVY